MLIFLVLLKIANFLSWRQVIVLGLFELLSIIYRNYERRNDAN
jgi:hypothetical protein